MSRTVLLANPIGFCGGARRAFQLFQELAKRAPGKPIYVLRELVHNRAVTDAMKRDGAVFVEDIGQVPEGSTLLLGAHGTGPKTRKLCQDRHLEIHDAVCPVVAKLHDTAKTIDQSTPVILLGDKDHTEIRQLLEWLS